MTSAYDFEAVDIDGKTVSLSDYRGKALLIVNVASKCGFTPQYTGLEKLWHCLLYTSVFGRYLNKCHQP